MLPFFDISEIGTMQESVEALEARLAEREQLVAALTERLEQAAEQLDRLHRTGADRTLRTGISGVPPELIAQQQKLVEDLQRAVDQWEAMQPGAFFARLETRLGQIHERVLQFDRQGTEQASGSAFNFEAGRSGNTPSGHGEPRRGSAESPRSILEFMKASQQPAPDENEPPLPTAADIPTAASAATVLDIALPPLSDPPPPIEVAQATPEELGQACEVRDSYITYLLQRLRQIESLGHVPHSWAGLENAPEELRSRLEALEHRLQETLRLAEVELSLQRAKLARDELRIRVMDEQMQKDLKRDPRRFRRPRQRRIRPPRRTGGQPLETDARTPRRRQFVKPQGRKAPCLLWEGLAFSAPLGPSVKAVGVNPRIGCVQFQ